VGIKETLELLGEAQWDLPT